MSNFSDTLKNLREKNNLSRKEMADKMGVTTSAYTNYEAGYREPKLEYITKMADILNVSIDRLLGREQEEVLFARIKQLAEKHGYEIILNCENWTDCTEIYISYVGRYKGELITFERILSRDNFLKTFAKIMDECEEEKEKLFQQKVKLYLFDAVLGSIDPS